MALRQNPSQIRAAAIVSFAAAGAPRVSTPISGGNSHYPVFKASGPVNKGPVVVHGFTTEIISEILNDNNKQHNTLPAKATNPVVVAAARAPSPAALEIQVPPVTSTNLPTYGPQSRSVQREGQSVALDGARAAMVVPHLIGSRTIGEIFADQQEGEPTLPAQVTRTGPVVVAAVNGNVGGVPGVAAPAPGARVGVHPIVTSLPGWNPNA
jgi:hypothetical protein